VSFFASHHAAAVLRPGHISWGWGGGGGTRIKIKADRGAAAQISWRGGRGRVAWVWYCRLRILPGYRPEGEGGVCACVVCLVSRVSCRVPCACVGCWVCGLVFCLCFNEVCHISHAAYAPVSCCAYLSLGYIGARLRLAICICHQLLLLLACLVSFGVRSPLCLSTCALCA
jgi:hypothetical protein